MKKILTTAAIAAGLIVASASAMAEDAPKTDAKPPMHHGEGHGEHFAKADKNKDGFLTKEEMQEAQQERLNEMFAKLDTNKDGKLSKEEMAAGKKQMREKMKAHWEERKAKHDGAGKEAPKPAEADKVE